MHLFLSVGGRYEAMVIRKIFEDNKHLRDMTEINDKIREGQEWVDLAKFQVNHQLARKLHIKAY